MHAKQIKITKIVTNDGQIEGLPKNPRFIRDERFEKLVQSIRDFPEMMHLRELIVVEHGTKFVTIGGNMRLRALKHLGYTRSTLQGFGREYARRKAARDNDQR